MIDVAIVGGGVAGLTAAIYAARGGHSAVVFERAAIGGQISLTADIENYPAIPHISGFELAANMEKQAIEVGAAVRYEEVTSLELTTVPKRIVTNTNVYEAKNVILAMGATPRKLNLANEESYIGRGISFCAVCDAAFYRDKTAAVVGGGNTAVQDAVHLARFAKKVYLVHRRTEFRAAKAELVKLSDYNNIEIVTPFTPFEIVIENDMVSGLRLVGKTGKKRTIQLDGIFIAIGYTPNTELVRDKINLNENGYIVTDSRMRTNLPKVFAAGDVVEKHLRQLITAENDGAIAASFLS